VKEVASCRQNKPRLMATIGLQFALPLWGLAGKANHPFTLSF
jgi:hypothetical protein